MKESKAWRILAEKHDAGTSGSSYLCTALSRCLEITPSVRGVMRYRIQTNLGGLLYAYDLFRVEPSEARASRVLACLMFAEQAKDEERAARKAA